MASLKHIAAAGAALALLVAIFIITRPAQAPGKVVVECLAREGTAYHIHAHLDIFVNGERVPVPPNIGQTGTCIYELHTHERNGVVHIEANRKKDFTLGSFFGVWGKRFNSTNLLGSEADGVRSVKMYVNGVENNEYESYVLKYRDVITLEYGPPFVPPPPYTFAPGE